MNISTVIRAWKDEAFRQSLSEAELALLPENPAGLLELTDQELALVAGGKKKTRRKNSSRSGRSGRGGRSRS